MSYTFSRRNFMKYTALAAVAVAASGMLTGCSNPNQPSGKAGDTLSFGGSDGVLGLFGNSDKHTLDKNVTYDGTTLTCKFTHEPVTDGTSSAANHYQIRILKKDGTTKYFVTGKSGVKATGTNEGTMKSGVKLVNTLTITGLDFTDAKEVYIEYYPRNNALGNAADTYTDIYATWDITSNVLG